MGFSAFTFWNWVALGCLAISALGVATEGVVRRFPDFKVKVDRSKIGTALSFGPMILVVVAVSIFLFRLGAADEAQNVALSDAQDIAQISDGPSNEINHETVRPFILRLYWQTMFTGAISELSRWAVTLHESLPANVQGRTIEQNAEVMVRHQALLSAATRAAEAVRDPEIDFDELELRMHEAYCAYESLAFQAQLLVVIVDRSGANFDHETPEFQLWDRMDQSMLEAGMLFSYLGFRAEYEYADALACEHLGRLAGQETPRLRLRDEQ